MLPRGRDTSGWGGVTEVGGRVQDQEDGIRVDVGPASEAVGELRVAAAAACVCGRRSDFEAARRDVSTGGSGAII